MRPQIYLGRDFVFPDYRPRYPRQTFFKIEHYRLEFSLNLEEKSIEGTATITLNTSDGKAYLDAVDFTITSVENCRYSYDGSVLSLILPQPGRHVVKVSYKAWPRTGLFFILPDKHHPDRQPFVWSHGEPEYHRHWMPVYDYPNMKFTTELLITVPDGLETVSNGELVEVRDIGDGRRQWHWVMDKPHTAYLVSFVAGLFDRVDEVVDGVRLEYIVPKGMKDYVKNSFSKTGDMLRFFASFLDYPYPFKVYRQVCVPEFVVGGMENTTAATLTELTLHDDHAHMDFSSDPLVAHELAHQWFGDLVTCRDWSHIWLNESFATYLENLYLLNDKGAEEFLYELYNDLTSYLDEYQKRYSRPIVTRLYRYPEELFDRHAYPKGGLVLHTIRNIVGDEAFRKALKNFLQTHAFATADTEDLRRSLEQSSGMFLEHVFDQLVYSAGHPALKVSYKWDEDSSELRLSVKQTQGEDSPQTYSLKIDVHIHTGRETTCRTVSLEERETTLSVKLGERPWHVCVDPEMKIIRSLDVDRPVEECIQAVKRCPHILCRIDAAKALGRHGGLRAVEALESVVLNDPFWGVAYQAAKALGEIKSPEACKALLRCLDKVVHPKVRRGVVEALGAFESDTSVADRLAAVVDDKRESYYVRQSACISLGRLKIRETLDVLKRALTYPSHAHVIPAGAVTGLAETGFDEALQILSEMVGPQHPTPVRVAATVGLAKYPGRPEVITQLTKLSEDSNERVRHAVVAAARELLDPKLLPVLDKMAERDLNERVRRSAREVAKKIRDHLERGVEYKLLREELEKVREENRRLSERLFKVEGKL